MFIVARFLLWHKSVCNVLLSAFKIYADVIEFFVNSVVFNKLLMSALLFNALVGENNDSVSIADSR